MNAELISTGSELLSGRTVNRHAQALGGRLLELGIRLMRDTTVPDDPECMRDAVQSAAERADLLFISGGLGPTSDDITRDVLAEWLGRGIVTNATALEHIRVRCEAAGRTMNDARARQALVLEGAEVLPNRAGAAPGEMIELDGHKRLFVLPGPPSEFQAVLDDEIMPRLRELPGVAASTDRVFMTCGMPEADVVTAFERERIPVEGLAAAFCSAPGRVEIRLSDTGAGPEALEQEAEKVRGVVGSHLFAEECITLEEALGRKLSYVKATLAVAESCTGGMVGERLTSAPGSSVWFKGGIIAYANEVKEQQLRVPASLLDTHGAVSAPVAEAMAEGVKARLGTDYALAVTGIAGPDGGTAEKPVGLVYTAVAGPDSVHVEEHRFKGNRDAVRLFGSQAVLYELWTLL